MISSDASAIHKSSRAATCINSISALVLWLAAWLKWRELPLLDRMDNGLPEVAVGIIAFEATLGTWLLIGRWPRWINWLPTCCFTVFALVALFLALRGAESCGCFGRLKVSPWITFLMDVGLAGMLWVFRPPLHGVIGGCILPRVVWRCVVAGAVTAGAIVLGVRQLSVASASDGEPGMLQAGNLTILEPREWVGKEWPLLARLDEPAGLESGRWLVVLHSAHCSTCVRALPGFEELAREGTGSGEPFRVALVEMPPHEATTHDSSAASHRRLSAEREWFAMTPVAMLLEDGITRDVIEGEAAVGVRPDWGRMKLIGAK